MKRLYNGSEKDFSYNDSIENLEEYYENQYKLIMSGNTDLASLKLVMLGNALDFIHFIQRSFGIKLDSSERSVDELEEVMDALNRGIVQENLFSRNDGDLAKKAGAYLGFLIIANIGGSWVDTENSMAVELQGREVYVCDFIKQRLVSGTELNVSEYYRSVRLLKTKTNDEE